MAETIKSYSDKVNAAFDEIGTSVDTLVTTHQGLLTDVTFLKDTIFRLQNNPGPISAEDQALLDAGVPRAEQTVAKFKAVADQLKALDQATEGPIVEPPPEA